ncbi:hypothetical protein EC968_009118 [Mortierella alpina]|nr:hypothetical protein EC968_009118 [Mortierella alpina]
MSQRTPPRDSSSSPADEPPHPSTRPRHGRGHDHSTLLPKTLRPSSTPAAPVANNNSSSLPPPPPVLSSAASISSSNTGSTRKTATRPSTLARPTMRPKTSYQAVTWKENLDAFNRRLRRGSLSLDAAAQEEELLLAAQAAAQAQTHHQHDPTRHRDHDRVHGGEDAGSEEHTQLLEGENADTKSSQAHKGGFSNYGAIIDPRPGQPPPPAHPGQPHHTSHHDHRDRDRGEPAEPVFPTLLNPAVATTKSSKLGVFSGVFVPCVLSIWGIILFLRFGFIIGQAGVMGTLAMFVVGYAINIFTALSLSAISSNGFVRGGGVYYLLSRSLGPEFGGSIGLIFFLCTVMGCGMNVLGFVEPLVSNFGESSGTVYRLWAFIYGTILLVSCTLVCLVGSKLFSRASLLLAVVILLSTLSIFVSFAVMPPFTHPERNIEYTSFSWDTLQENMWPRFTTSNGPDGEKQSFQTVFGVLFPACIGILAGASMSGDLEDPSKSIPKGTLWAVGSTFCVYTCIVILMGGSISRSTMYSDLSVLQDISISPLFIASGALAASVFATLGSVIGAAKILQAIARDNLLPLLSIFGQGTPKTDEPTLAVLLTYILCQFCLFLTDMNMIATFVSMITLLTFLILNLACFLLKIGSAPNFRPSFRFFHWWTAFGGMFLCALVMGFVDLGKSLLSGLMTAVLFIWIHYWSPPKRWGDVTQSLIYHQVRKYLLRLDSRKEHVKFWRPQILLLVHHPRSEYHLIQFCNHLKKGALYVLGHVIVGDLRDVLHEYRRQQSSWLKFVDVLHIKAFVNLSIADNVRIGARNLLIGTGLGGMRPNIVVLGSFNLDRYFRDKHELQQEGQAQMYPLSPMALHQTSFPTPRHMGSPRFQHHTALDMPLSLPIDNMRVETPIKITEYVSIIEDVLSLNKAVAIGCGFDRLELPEEHKSVWKQFFTFDSLRTAGTPLSPFFSTSSRPSSLHRHGDRKKKYIDLWPMQMSVAPLRCFDAGVQQPSFSNPKRHSKDLSFGSPVIPTFSDTPLRAPEANLTNFDTYTMVLQMGCILHMVPHWKENFVLRVMVFVEYKEDVAQEKERLKALLENLRIPAEVKVMCLDGGDSDTYHRLVNGTSTVETDDDYPMESGPSPKAPGSDFDDETSAGSERDGMSTTIAPIAQRAVPRNINPFWQQHAAVEEEGGESTAGREDIHGGPATDGQDSSHEAGPYSAIAAEGYQDRSKNLSSSPPGQSPRGQQHQPVFQASAPAPQRRRTISHADHFQQQQQQQQVSHRRQSPNPLRVNTALSPRLWQRSPIAVASAYPSSSHHHHFASGSGGGGGGGARYRSTMASSISPMIDSRLGTSAPLGASMNFRIAVPLPKQYFDPNGVNSSESESDSISSEDDEDYDHNDDDLHYGGRGINGVRPTIHRERIRPLPMPLHPQQQQQQQQQQQLLQHQQQHPQSLHQAPPTTPAHTSLGSESSGLGIEFEGASSTNSEQRIPGQAYPHQRPHPYHHEYPDPQQQPQPQARLPPIPSSLGGSMGNPWATSPAGSSSLSTSLTNSNNRDIIATSPANNHRNAHGWGEEEEDGIWSNDRHRDALPSMSLAHQQQHQHQQQQQQQLELEQHESLSPSSALGPGSGPVLPPLQFDHLAPEAQLMILNELMRIHSSAETTSIIFTTMPAPEEGTCLREESSLAYLEQLDLLMDGIEIPVLLIHAKSLTVTMTL